MSKQRIEIGDLVSYDRFSAGVVVKIRLKTSRKLVSMARQFVEPIRRDIESTATKEVAEVQLLDGALWTVRLASLRFVRKATPAELNAGAVRASKIKNAPRDRKDAATSASFDAGFHLLEAGAPVEINFSDIGWSAATFVRVNSGGRVTYSRNGRERHAHPSLVRRAEGGAK